MQVMKVRSRYACVVVLFRTGCVVYRTTSELTSELCGGLSLPREFHYWRLSLRNLRQTVARGLVT